MREQDRWVWRRWQLVHVDHDDGEVVLDAIELSSSMAHVEAGPVTVVFRDPPATESTMETIGEMLQRWVARENGLCDVFHREDAPLEMFAMFQGTDSVLASVHGEG